MAAVLILPLTFAMGAAVDMSRVHAAKGALQDQVDAAALSSAVAAGENPANAQAAAEAEARAILGTAPAPPGVVVGETPMLHVTVAARRTVELAFGSIVGVARMNVGASATAAAPAKAPLCLLLTGGGSAWIMSGPSRVNAQGCTVQVNSGSASALTTSGASAVTAPDMRVVGPENLRFNGTPPPLFRQPVLADPYAGKLPWPADTVACNQPAQPISGGARTLSPGVYCGGFDLSGGAVVTLAPGLYVIKMGGLNLSGGASMVGRNGVTVVMLDPAADVVLSGSTLELQAPTTGNWRGVALAVKPQAAVRKSDWSGTSVVSVNGLYYAPSHEVLASGSSRFTGTAGSRSLVARNFDMSSSANIDLTGGTAGGTSTGAAAGGPRLLR